MKYGLAVTIGGFCFGIMVLLLIMAYIPNYAPAVYLTIRRSGLIMVIPLIVVLGAFSSIIWLWIECKEKEGTATR